MQRSAMETSLSAQPRALPEKTKPRLVVGAPYSQEAFHLLVPPPCASSGHVLPLAA